MAVQNPHCGSSTTYRRPDLTKTRDFKAFHRYVTSTRSLTEIACDDGVSRWTLDRRFEPLWLIDVPNIPDPNRVYDQIFIDGTHTDAGCLLVAASYDHVIAWHWARTESTHAYTQLLRGIAQPLCVVLDGGQGAYSAIKACWPKTMIQRCLVHAQRVIRRYTTSRPRTDAGKAIYALALKLTKITTLDQARQWTIRLHEFGVVYKDFLNDKTPAPKERRTPSHQWEFTHIRVRKACNSLLRLSRKNWLFAYLQPPRQKHSNRPGTISFYLIVGGSNKYAKLRIIFFALLCALLRVSELTIRNLLVRYVFYMKLTAHSEGVNRA